MPKLHDVTVVTKRDYSCAKVEAVPPEEFGISRRARRIADADYCYHEVERSEIDLIPFAAGTPVPVTHRFFGRSAADLVIDIQKIKTALIRALLDNAYLLN